MPINEPVLNVEKYRIIPLCSEWEQFYHLNMGKVGKESFDWVAAMIIYNYMKNNFILKNITRIKHEIVLKQGI